MTQPPTPVPDPTPDSKPIPALRPAMRRRFYQALGAYGVLGILAWTTLDGGMRWLVLLLLAALAVKSWIHLRRMELE